MVAPTYLNLLTTRSHERNIECKRWGGALTYAQLVNDLTVRASWFSHNFTENHAGAHVFAWRSDRKRSARTRVQEVSAPARILVYLRLNRIGYRDSRS